MRLRASRDIKEGEEITISYANDLFVPAAKRHENLASYEFKCACPSCVNYLLTDPVRCRLGTMGTKLGDDFSMWKSNPSLPDDYVLKKLLYELKATEIQGLEGTDVYFYLLTITFQVYGALADLKKAIEYGEKAGRRDMANGKGRSSLELFTNRRSIMNLSWWAARRKAHAGKS
jgi:hypothetical protein